MLTWTRNRGRVNLLYWISEETNTIGHPLDSSHWLPIRRAEQKQPSISEGSNLTLHLNWRSHGCSLAKKKSEEELYNQTAEINCWKEEEYMSLPVLLAFVLCLSCKKKTKKVQSLSNYSHFGVCDQQFVMLLQHLFKKLCMNSCIKWNHRNCNSPSEQPPILFKDETQILKRPLFNTLGQSGPARASRLSQSPAISNCQRSLENIFRFAELQIWL